MSLGAYASEINNFVSYRFKKTFSYPWFTQNNIPKFYFFTRKAVIVNGSLFIKETPISVIRVVIFRQLIPSNFCKPFFELSDIICTFVTKRKPRSFAIRSYFDQEAL